MRFVFAPATLAAAATLAFATIGGCAQPGARSIEGRAERGTTAVLAIDAAGNTFKAIPDASLAFHLDVLSSLPVKVVALKPGLVQTMVFAAHKGALRVATEIPNNEGTVTLGALSTCDCSGTGSPETTPSDNPLTQCDSDGNGVDDYDDDHGDDHGDDGHNDCAEGEGEGGHDGDDDGDDDGDHHDGGGGDDGGSDDGDHHGGNDGGDDGSNNCDQPAAGEGEGAAAAGEGEGEGEGSAPEIPPQG